jgi:hypothetical protein
VTIESPGAPPTIEELDVGRLKWITAQHEVHSSKDLGTVISQYSRETNADRVLLRLALKGVLDPAAFDRIGSELSTIVYRRYHDGSALLAEDVLIEPDAAQIQECVGTGVLSRVLQRLREESQASEVRVQRVARHALKLLYQLAREEQPS